MFHSKFKKCGFALAECLVTLAVLTTAVIVSGFITNNALSTTNLSRDYLVAQNLATEGIEVVKSLRNTNRMIYPDKKQCWLVLGACTSTPTLPANNSNYILALNNGLFYLKSAGANSLNLDSSNASSKTPYQLYIENSRYVGYTANPPAGAKTSKYFRSVKFVSITDTDADAVTDTATVEVKMQWKEGVKTREINEKITLYNFL